jgi:hypothetical protein
VKRGGDEEVGLFVVISTSEGSGSVGFSRETTSTDSSPTSGSTSVNNVFWVFRFFMARQSAVECELVLWKLHQRLELRD